MKTFAVIVAGGSGNRMGTTLPKQFLDLEGKPLIVHSVEAFQKAFTSIEFIIVLPAAYQEMGKEFLLQHLPDINVHFTEGGSTRFDSVKKGLQKVKGPAIVFIHDAVRCLVSTSLIQRCYDQARHLGTAIPAVAVKDSIRMISDDINKVVNRDTLRSVQTPQTFHSDIIIPAFQQDYEPSFTDEATVVEKYGQKIELIEGEETNIKVTYPVDLLVAASILRNRKVVS
ncbi:MAG: 2-C-methyl-D-erythritol 4-phosphate cytidylyltransferase [Chitinophagaceae bacterium]